MPRKSATDFKTPARHSSHCPRHSAEPLVDRNAKVMLPSMAASESCPANPLCLESLEKTCIFCRHLSRVISSGCS